MSENTAVAHRQWSDERFCVMCYATCVAGCKVDLSRFFFLKGLLFVLMSTSSSSVEIAFVFVQTLWTKG